MNLQNAKLPKCPDPACVACQTKIPQDRIKPYSAHTVHSRLVVVNVLAKCPACDHAHIGTRSLAVAFMSMRYLRQHFETFTEARLAELKAVLEFLTKGAQGGEHYLSDLPDHPQLVVWFEYTLADPSRAAPAKPVSGLIEAALPESEGIEIVERRYAEPCVLRGIRFNAQSVSAAIAFVEQLRETARANGTIAWIRRYDQPEFAVRWDVDSPSPGTDAFLSHHRAA